MTLRLVHLEDDLNDRELVAGALRSDGIVCTIAIADSMETFAAALAEPADVILADLAVPGFDGIAAQRLAASTCPHVPFLFVSGSMGEEVAIERMKEGATDYVLKHRLEKLATSVRRAVREAEALRERKNAEAALRQLNAELEARVRDRTQALSAANAALEEARSEAERANRAKSEFLSRMSHDLRTPLNAIMGFAQLLELDPLAPEQADAVAHILRAGKHLLGLINEVLDLARIEAGHMSISPEPVSVSDVVHHVVNMIRPLAQARRLSLDVVADPSIHALADRQRLNEILLNLLSNALKYNRDGGSVRVSCHGVNGSRIAIVVADSGPGIPREKLSLLFTPFERLGADVTGIEGTGLGLAVSKGFAELMQGTLTIESVVDQGTIATLELPKSKPVAARPDPPDMLVPEIVDSAGTVLYIEDNVSNLRLMQVVMTRRSGVELIHAADGPSGLALLRTRRPQLVFLDLHLPGMPGEEVLRQMWEDPTTRSIPVAVLSADATPAQKRRLLASGAAHYLTKPFRIADVLQLVDRALGAIDVTQAARKP